MHNKHKVRCFHLKCANTNPIIGGGAELVRLPNDEISDEIPSLRAFRVTL